jgi:hypothetical protein
LIEHVSSIQCYTCNVDSGYQCPLPLNLDGGDESNESEVATFNYNPDHVCMVRIWSRKKNICLRFFIYVEWL